jgi:uroporphyrinogen decarboxylase
MGNIYGRLERKTKGECVKGALQEGWEALDRWVLPVIDEKAEENIKSESYRENDKYVLGGLPFAIFSSLRDCRHMDNALMDTILEPDCVKIFLDRIMDLAVKILDRAAARGVDGIMIADDMGTQISLFFSPGAFRELFKPYYKKLAGEIHSRGMDFFLHSCGKVYDIVGDLVEAGVDVFQFDQPELSGSEVWAREFGSRAVFYCPVDIQKIMVSGDRRLIEEGALHMVNSFKKYGGSLIAKDYPAWGDINVLPEWAQWARNLISANAAL